MKSFPMFIRTTGRRVVIVGGGEQAAQKARLMLKTDARLTVVAAAPDPELAALVACGRADLLDGPVTAAAFAETAMVFVGTGCPGADAARHGLAKAGGAAVNVVDRPDLCDLTTPALVDRDPVVVAIGTEGAAPVLARRIKTRIEAMLDPRLGAHAALAGRLRDAVARRVPRAARRGFWDWAFSGTPWIRYLAGDEAGAARAMKSAIAGGGPPQASGAGLISLVGAGPGARDLLTLRAVERLQAADAIFYDRLVDPGVLELARRDAERVCVGKAVGAASWPQDRISALIVAEARRGKRVVRLKSGDPGVFGRAAEELAAARAAGVPAEIVPGITAASGAAAAMGRTLTTRGETDTLVIATATCRPGDADPDWAHHLRAGTTLALYMGAGRVAEIRRRLLTAGAAEATPVEIAVDATHASERIVATTLGSLEAAACAQAITGNALILIRFPKTVTTGRAAPAPDPARQLERCD